MANITITVQSLLNTALYDSYTIDNGQTVNQLKTAVNSARGFDSTWYDIVLNESVASGSATLSSLGIVSGTRLRTHNKIGRLATKELRQVAKLNLATLDRVASGEARSSYNITALPTYYVGNTVTDNANTGGLIEGRPWTAIPGSLLFNGSNYLTVDGNASTAMGLENFTWECFVYPTSSTNYQTFIDTRTNPVGGDTAGFYFGTDNNTLTPIFYTNALRLSSSIDITLNAWNHVALTRLNGTATLWVNGASGGTVADATSLSQQRVYIGGSSILRFTGYMSNLRMLKGSAEYTATFTPPGGPLPVITNTVLLLNSSFDTNFLKDSSINNFTVTNTDGVTSDALNPFSA